MKIALKNLLLVLCLGLFVFGCKNPTTNPRDVGPGDATEPEMEGPVDMDNAGADDSSKLGKGEANRIDMGGPVDWSQAAPVYFDYDSAMIRTSEQTTLNELAGWAKENPGKKILVAGHCDERGTLEYNRALGQRRAAAAREYLIKKGVPASNIGTVSYGEEKPANSGKDEAAWTKNRRAEFGVVK